MPDLGAGLLLGAPITCPPVVHQAVGMTMEYVDCTPVQAYRVLVDRAQATGQCIAGVALDVVEHRLCLGHRHAERDRAD